MSRRTLTLKKPVEAPPEPAITLEEGHSYPSDWRKGQLLNVRNAGSHYNVTLLGEEYDPRYPERCLQFPHPAACQNFISWWYARDSHDPRAG